MRISDWSSDVCSSDLRSIVPVIDADGKLVLTKDEHPRPETTREGLAALKPAFAQIADMPIDANGNTFRKIINQVYPDLKIEAFHHAGTSSGNGDGAAALLLPSAAYVRKPGRKPPTRNIAGANNGDDPTLTLHATATRRATE